MATPVSPTVDLLVRFLEQEKIAGRTHAWVSPEARSVLRALAISGRPAGKPKGARPLAAPSPAPPKVARAGSPARQGAKGFRIEVPEDSDKLRRLEELQREVLGCPQYRELIERGALRDTMVFAVGNPHSPLMFIGEAPGAEEERRREPFVGPAGQLLTKIVQSMGLERSQVYISNIVKYRPAIAGGSQGEKNRKPEPAEMTAARPHILKEISIVRPKVMVALGGTAAEGLLGEPVAITRVRGRFRDFEGIPLMPTFHPSYLLRNAALEERRKLWEDILQVMERLAMPISDAQRKFFLVGVAGSEPQA